MGDSEGQSDDTPSASAAPQSSSSSGSSWASWSAWGQSWMDTVKEKSAHTMEMVKKDLNEFVDVIQGDTSEVMSETAARIEPKEEEEEVTNTPKEDSKITPVVDSLEAASKVATKVVRKGMANLLNSVSELMAVPPDDSKEEVITIPDLSPTQNHYDRKQEKLRSLQTDPGTYCNEPEGLFNDWLEVFQLDDNKKDMSNMLVQNPAIRAIYTQLVPAVVSHTTFWQRYYYQVFLLESEEKRREEIVARANKETSDDGDEEGSGWGDDDDDDDDGIEVVSTSTSSLPPDPTVEATTVDDVSDKQVESEDGELENVTLMGSEIDAVLSDGQTAQDNEDSPEEVHDGTSGGDEPIQQRSTEQFPLGADDKPEVMENSNDETLESSNDIDVPCANVTTTEPNAELVELEVSQPPEPVEQDLGSSKDSVAPTTGSGIEPVEPNTLSLTEPIEPNTVSLTEPIEPNTLSLTEPVESSTVPKTEPVERNTIAHTEPVEHNISPDKMRLKSPVVESLSQDSETCSVGSWMSIDDEIKVKQIKGEVHAKCETNDSPGDVSTDSNNGVIVNQSDLLDSDDEDFDLDEDVDEEEVAKMVSQIKNSSGVDDGSNIGNLDDDDDWEKWE